MLSAEISPEELSRLHSEVREYFPELKGLPGTITHDPTLIDKLGQSMVTSIPCAGRRHEGYNVYVGPYAPRTESGLKDVIAYELAQVVLNLNWLRQRARPVFLADQTVHKGEARDLCRQRGFGRPWTMSQ